MFASLLLIQGQLTETKLLGVYNLMLLEGFLNLLSSGLLSVFTCVSNYFSCSFTHGL